ncbi:hypothetical protein [Acuticoccus mangrovi]|uniref:Tat pathway signal sequence domain protein n=1 Tax=Acuticoccus mangrovi TaxID=2796142 RepID=A0A934IJ88_9HYPH|nr:hypothetical protein [Acuticoccus mangrovi]MBJ3776011.1 hypothetical protein [Acuticoccus mangrovi]
MGFRLGTAFAAGAMLTAAMAAPALGDTTAAAPDAAAPTLHLELNNLAPHADGCRVTFLVRNGLPSAIDELSLEVAVFKADGPIERLMRLNFGVLIKDKTRIRQFDLDGTPCPDIGRILVNDVATCDGPSLTPLDCLKAIEVGDDAKIPFGL